MQGDSITVTLLVTEVLEKMEVPYAVCGSLSSSLHGVMRSTLDVDLIADLRLEHIQTFINALSSFFYVDDEMIRGAVEHRSSFNLIHYHTAYKVDIFIPKQRAFDRIQLERRAASIISTDSERIVYVISAEDVILSKLEWYCMGGEVSDRQWKDILGVMKTKLGNLDLDYLHRWAKELNVSDLLELALSESNSTNTIHPNH